MDLTHPVEAPRVEEDALRGGGLASVYMSGDADVSRIG
jgi:hypothetical protein